MYELLRAGLNLPLFALVLCRSAGIMLAAPVLSSISVPLRVKTALAVLLGLVMFPFASRGIGNLPGAVLGYVPVVAGELGLGLLMGFSAGMVLASLEAAGGLAAQQLGMALAHVVSPDQQQDKHALSAFLGVFGVLLFLAVDGHHWLIHAVAVSYRAIPLGQVKWRPEFAEAINAGFSIKTTRPSRRRRAGAARPGRRARSPRAPKSATPA